jgi:predicted adenine nucleotide alpha hydrolase (AANH) superfamily ATPase
VLKTQEVLATEESTYKQMYDRDLGLIRSEKEALLRFMRESVKENGEFLQRIRELEDQNEELLRQQDQFEARLGQEKAILERQVDMAKAEVVDI